MKLGCNRVTFHIFWFRIGLAAFKFCREKQWYKDAITMKTLVPAPRWERMPLAEFELLIFRVWRAILLLKSTRRVSGIDHGSPQYWPECFCYYEFYRLISLEIVIDVSLYIWGWKLLPKALTKRALTKP